MSHSPYELLRHMLDEILYIESMLPSLKEDDFYSDETLKRAFVRSIEVMGEASNKIDASFQKNHPDIPWIKMNGIRNRLIHAYFSVSYEIVWNVATVELIKLKSQIEAILGSIDTSQETME